MKENKEKTIKVLRIIGAILISSFLYFELIRFTGEKLVEEDWKEVGLEGLKEKCDYLINTRGIEGWKIQ